ncbi:MAG: hypothetical protein UY41_C0018G0019 [Candidatus Moranbacteria bacterium GW2011_GWE1_49_15]|nr:MAG: hypothetical protein UY41_C0018G0019 [Candidatus Moranbacteria bacterium GW2011_GWE1_49_15]HBP00714.1 hypothetical protein [Candidatus Moranbacteria bacterium]
MDNFPFFIDFSPISCYNIATGIFQLIIQTKNMKTKIFKPTSEKIFVSLMPFVPVIPIALYVVLGSFSDLEASRIGSFFYALGFLSYNFILLFAIPFEGILSFIGMMEFGGGMFSFNMLGLSFAGILLVQAAYAVVFYFLFSVTSRFRLAGRKMRFVLGGKN